MFLWPLEPRWGRLPGRFDLVLLYKVRGLPRWLSGKESTCQAEDAGSIPGSGRSPGEGSGCLLQCSCLRNPMDREAWWATVHWATRVGHDLQLNNSEARKESQPGRFLAQDSVSNQSSESIPLPQASSKTMQNRLGVCCWHLNSQSHVKASPMFTPFHILGKEVLERCLISTWKRLSWNGAPVYPSSCDLCSFLKSYNLFRRYTQKVITKHLGSQ